MNRLPTPLSMHLIVVGGDACLASRRKAWEASWTIVSSKLHLAPPGSRVIYGPQKGSPDALASQAVLFSRHQGLCYGRDGLIRGTALFSRDEEYPDEYHDRVVGRWSHQPTPEGLAMELAQHAALRQANGWGVEAYLIHGWDGSFRGERLAERLRHLGIEPHEWDVAEDGRVSDRSELPTAAPPQASC